MYYLIKDAPFLFGGLVLFFAWSVGGIIVADRANQECWDKGYPEAKVSLFYNTVCVGMVI